MRQGLIPYDPNPVPNNQEELTSYIAEELQRISFILKHLTQYHLFGIEVENEPFPLVSGAGSKFLFVGINANIDSAGNAWNPATGEWTCPLTGEYVVSFQCSSLVPVSATKTRYDQYMDIFVDGSPRVIQSGYGKRNYESELSLCAVVPFNKGQVMKFHLTLDDAGYTGDIDVDGFVTIFMVK